MKYLIDLLARFGALFGLAWMAKSAGKEKQKRKSTEQAMRKVKDAKETRSNYRKSSKSKRRRLRDKYRRD